VLIWLGDTAETPDHPRVICIHARSDLPERRNVPNASIPVSSVTGEGLQQLLGAVAEEAQSLLPGEGELALNRRQADLLAEVRDALETVAAAPDLVLVAEFLRSSRLALDRITGRAGVEDVLDALFGRFCLGK
jgi:tRNA modification GTPase